MRSYNVGLLMYVLCVVWLWGCFEQPAISERGIPKAKEELASCEDTLAGLLETCAKEDTELLRKPKNGTDYMGACLWAMGNVYGAKFPLGKEVEYRETRAGFFFECLDNYPNHFEEYCCGNLRDAKDTIKALEDHMSDLREECERLCIKSNAHSCRCY